MENILQETAQWFEEHYKSMKQKIVFILQFQLLAGEQTEQKIVNLSPLSLQISIPLRTLLTADYRLLQLTPNNQ